MGLVTCARARRELKKHRAPGHASARGDSDKGAGDARGAKGRAGAKDDRPRSSHPQINTLDALPGGCLARRAPEAHSKLNPRAAPPTAAAAASSRKFWSVRTK